MALVKLLKTIRFDGTDERVFEVAAAQGEWAITGTTPFVMHAPEDFSGKIKQAFSNGFFAVPSFGFSTFSTVVEASDADASSLAEALARHYRDALGAPDDAIARATAQDDVTSVIELCSDVAINTVLTIRRTTTDDGDACEEIRPVRAPAAEPVHTKIWEITSDDC